MGWRISFFFRKIKDFVNIKMMLTAKPTSINAYISLFPKNVQDILTEIRMAIKEVAPDAEEVISYGMPAFKYHGILVYFAAFKNHIGFYALPKGNKAFQKELSMYKTGKGSIQFPLHEKMPLQLIKKITAYRIAENVEKMHQQTKMKNEKHNH